jgi:hypothetical protein
MSAHAAEEGQIRFLTWMEEDNGRNEVRPSTNQQVANALARCCHCCHLHGTILLRCLTPGMFTLIWHHLR